MYTTQIKHRVKSGLFPSSMEDTEVNENNEYLYFIRHEYRQQKLKDKWRVLK